MAVTVLGETPISRIYHIADLHVRIDDERTDEYRRVFDRFLRLVRDGEEGRPDAGRCLIFVGGDVLDSKGKTSTSGAKLLFEFFNAASDICPVLLICGNHDFRQDDADVVDAIDMIVSPYLGTERRIFYLEETGLYRWGDVGFGLVSVRDTLRPSNTAGTVDKLPDFPAWDPSCEVRRRVALFHGTVTKSSLANGRRMFGYPLDWFEGYDMAMLGDNHTQQCGQDFGFTWAYPGSLVQQTFGESVFGHGYVLWDVESGTASFHHVFNENGLITVRDDGAVEMPQSVPLSEAARLAGFPTRPAVRVIGDAAAARALLDEHFDDYRVVKVLPHRGSERPDEQAVPLAGEVESSPEHWMRFLEEKGIPGEGVASMLIRDATLGTEKGSDDLRRLSEAYLESVKRHRSKISHVRIVSLSWSWLMCYGERNAFDFSRLSGRTTLLNGRNASGKSAVIDILVASMYGTAPGRGCICNTKAPAGARSESRVTLEVGGSVYTVSRLYSGRRSAPYTGAAS